MWNNHIEYKGIKITRGRLEVLGRGKLDNKYSIGGFPGLDGRNHE